MTEASKHAYIHTRVPAPVAVALFCTEAKEGTRTRDVSKRKKKISWARFYPLQPEKAKSRQLRKHCRATCEAETNKSHAVEEKRRNLFSTRYNRTCVCKTWHYHHRQASCIRLGAVSIPRSPVKSSHNFCQLYKCETELKILSGVQLLLQGCFTTQAFYFSVMEGRATCRQA